MENHPHFPVPPGLVDSVAIACHESMCETAKVTMTDGGSHAWAALDDQIRDAWRAVARQAIATTLNRMIHEGWLVVKPANIQEPPRC